MGRWGGQPRYMVRVWESRCRVQSAEFNLQLGFGARGLGSGFLAV